MSSVQPRPDGAPSAPACLIVNPRSFRASRGLAADAIRVARARGTDVVELSGMPDLVAALDHVISRRQQPLIVLSGDGTVHAIVDHLAHRPAGSWAPELVILPGGRTNLTAADLAAENDALAMLDRALQPAADTASPTPTRTERFTLRVEQPGAPARHGFFLAGALVDSIIRSTHDHRARGQGRLHVGHLSTAWSLMRLAALALVGRTGLHCPTLDIEVPGGTGLRGPVRLMLATTLWHRRGAFRPYAGSGNGRVSFTGVSRLAPGFWRSLPRLVTGRPSAKMTAANGYLTGRFDRVVVGGLEGYTLDGEQYDADPTRPLVLCAGPAFQFLTP